MRFLARYRKIINTLVVIICVILFVYFAYKTINMKDNNIEPSVYPGTAMGTTVKKTIYADSVSICDETNGLIDVALTELENQISVRVQNSEIYKLNSNYVVGGVNQVSDDLLSYLKVCRQICDDTNGAFSPCIRPLIALWGIEEGFDVIPEAAAIEEALQCSNPDYFEVVENGVIFTDVNMGIDLGAAGK